MSKSNKKKGYLYIKINKDIRDILNEYCKETGTDPQDPGFHTGYIIGGSNKEDVSIPLATINQMHFFAGIHFAMTNKNKKALEYTYKKDIMPQTMSAQILADMKNKKGESPKIKPPSYMG